MPKLRAGDVNSRGRMYALPLVWVECVRIMDALYAVLMMMLLLVYFFCFAFGDEIRECLRAKAEEIRARTRKEQENDKVGI